ncbi:MAG TPA: polysaccharide deacetylase family protein [Armatimonadota bacterium]|jgi:polysaccharide deacetylase family sporulation protein PdaB
MPQQWRSTIILIFLLAFVGSALTVLYSSIGIGQQAREPTVKTAEIVDPSDPYWEHAKLEVDRSVLELIAQHQAELARGTRYHKFMHGDTGKKWIALTFDDGPHPKFTPRILALLKQYHAKATFFVVGEMAEKYPDLVRAEIAAGHSVGNHTYHHVNLTKILEGDVATEIKACGEVLQKINGRAPRLFRPPGGDYDQGVAEAAEALGYTIVLWTDDPGDYAQPGDKVIASRILAHIHPGGIILIHDGIQQTIDVLPQILTYLQKQGYQFVTIDQMMKK